MTQPLKTEVRDKVLIITLNRPEAMNAINQALAELLAQSLDRLDNDDNLSVGILTGVGKGFCAGMDLKEFLSQGEPLIGDRGFGGMTAQASKKPLICAIEGFALAGGLELALASDLIVASKGSKLGIPEVSVGLFANAGAMVRLPRMLPYGRAMKMALTGEPILAEEAFEHGMVAELCERGEALNTAFELAGKIARHAPLALMASKHLIKEMQGRTEAEYWSYQTTMVDLVFNSADGKEGAAAFAEKRVPTWTGK